MVKDFGAELMAEDRVSCGVEIRSERSAASAGQIDHMLHMMQGVQIGPADAAGERAHQDLTFARLQVGDLVAHQLPVSADHCTHVGLPFAPCRALANSVTLAVRNR